MKAFLPVLLMFLALVGATASRADEPSGNIIGPPNLPATPLPGVLDIEPPRDSARPSENPRLDQSLVRLTASESRIQPLVEEAGLRLEDGRVQARLEAIRGEADIARETVLAAGGRVTSMLDDTLQVWLPVEHIEEVAGHPAVAFLGIPDYALPADDLLVDATSEGVALSNAAAWHQADWRGQGVRIAVIDAGFQGYPTRLGTELPDEVVTKNFVDGQPDAEVDATTRHGTACAEIVHDMAPMAELFLIKIATDLDLAQAVDYAIAQGVDVISTSLTFVNVTPGDGTGKFAAMTQKARDAGILWVTAAGNYRETHWGGWLADADGDGLHEFASGVEVNVFGPGNNTAYQIPAGFALSAALRWNDWASVRQDYRLLLLRYNGSSFDVVASANNSQTGLAGQRPTERINHITTGAAAVYGVAIQRVNGTSPVYFDLLTPNRELDRRMTAMSLGNLADVPAAMTVSAVNAGGAFLQESYSSEGPTNGPGGGPASGGPQKPDITAFANISTSSFGTRGFNGTSAATPHIAGAVALVHVAYPGFGPDQIRYYLEEQSIDQGAACADKQFGYGRLYLPLPGQLPGGNRLFFPYIGRGNDRC